MMSDAATPSQCPLAGVDDQLIKLSLIDPEVRTKPNDYYRVLRRDDPVHYDAKMGMYMVSRHADLQTVFRDPITFSQEKGWNQQFACGYLDELKEILIRDGG